MPHRLHLVAVASAAFCLPLVAPAQLPGVSPAVSAGNFSATLLPSAPVDTASGVSVLAHGTLLLPSLPEGAAISVVSPGLSTAPAWDDTNFDGFDWMDGRPLPSDEQRALLIQARAAALRDPGVRAAVENFRHQLAHADQVLRADLSRDPYIADQLVKFPDVDLLSGFTYLSLQPPLAYRDRAPPSPRVPAPTTTDDDPAYDLQQYPTLYQNFYAMQQARAAAIKDPLPAAAFQQALEAYRQAERALRQAIALDPTALVILDGFPYVKLSRDDLGFVPCIRGGPGLQRSPMRPLFSPTFLRPPVSLASPG